MSARRLSPAAMVAILASVAACTGSPTVPPTEHVQPPSSMASPPPTVAPPLPLGCPKDLAAALRRNDVPGSAKSIVPGAPSTLVVCAGSRRVVVAGDRVERLARSLNALERVMPGLFDRPAEFGPIFGLFFDYPNGRVLLVTVSASGCGFVTNGAATAQVDAATLRTVRRLSQGR